MAERITGRILWSNLNLLFWISLIPFMMGWMGAAAFAPVPTAGYGCVLLGAALAYRLLVRAILAAEGPESPLAAAIGRDIKGKVSASLYAVAIPAAFLRTWIADALYVLVAAIWFVPDRRIENQLTSR
jgi:uncharacterized membrane protein